MPEQKFSFTHWVLHRWWLLVRPSRYAQDWRRRNSRRIQRGIAEYLALKSSGKRIAEVVYVDAEKNGL